MSNKEQLRQQRYNTVINSISKDQEKDCQALVARLSVFLEEEFSVRLVMEREVYLAAVIASLRGVFPEVDFHCHFDNSSMRPDGGLLYLLNKNGDKYPILITEVKNQETNDLRKAEGKPKQARGNAIERLGKNVIGFRTFLLRESIFPFVCFGYGCDFDNTSSILDRVTTIAMFGRLNKIYLYNEMEKFNRGSFFFRQEPWSTKEMFDIMFEIAKSSIYYYFSKYGESAFI
jgi:type II restriction enzyme